MRLAPTLLYKLSYGDPGAMGVAAVTRMRVTEFWIDSLRYLLLNEAG